MNRVESPCVVEDPDRRGRLLLAVRLLWSLSKYEEEVYVSLLHSGKPLPAAELAHRVT